MYFASYRMASMRDCSTDIICEQFGGWRCTRKEVDFTPSNACSKTIDCGNRVTAVVWEGAIKATTLTRREYKWVLCCALQ